jgi:hypothetical protein
MINKHRPNGALLRPSESIAPRAPPLTSGYRQPAATPQNSDIHYDGTTTLSPKLVNCAYRRYARKLRPALVPKRDGAVGVRTVCDSRMHMVACRAGHAQRWARFALSWWGTVLAGRCPAGGVRVVAAG